MLMLLLSQAAALVAPPRLASVSTISVASRAGSPCAFGGAGEPSEALRSRLKVALEKTDTSAEVVRVALVEGHEDDFLVLTRVLRPLVGATLAPRVAELAQEPMPGFKMAGAAAGLLGEFEARALELMASEQWLDAHDVVAGELLGQESPSPNPGAVHAHEAMMAARLMEAICANELACANGELAAAIDAHEAAKSTPLACGCVSKMMP